MACPLLTPYRMGANMGVARGNASEQSEPSS